MHAALHEPHERAQQEDDTVHACYEHRARRVSREDLVNQEEGRQPGFVEEPIRPREQQRRACLG